MAASQRFVPKALPQPRPYCRLPYQLGGQQGPARGQHLHPVCGSLWQRQRVVQKRERRRVRCVHHRHGARMCICCLRDGWPPAHGQRAPTAVVKQQLAPTSPSLPSPWLGSSTSIQPMGPSCGAGQSGKQVLGVCERRPGAVRRRHQFAIPCARLHHLRCCHAGDPATKAASGLPGGAHPAPCSAGTGWGCRWFQTAGEHPPAGVRPSSDFQSL